MSATGDTELEILAELQQTLETVFDESEYQGFNTKKTRELMVEKGWSVMDVTTALVLHMNLGSKLTGKRVEDEQKLLRRVQSLTRKGLVSSSGRTTAQSITLPRIGICFAPVLLCLTTHFENKGRLTRSVEGSPARLSYLAFNGFRHMAPYRDSEAYIYDLSEKLATAQKKPFSRAEVDHFAHIGAQGLESDHDLRDIASEVQKVLNSKELMKGAMKMTQALMGIDPSDESTDSGH